MAAVTRSMERFSDSVNASASKEEPAFRPAETVRSMTKFFLPEFA
jgi:hypothetical protein